MDLSPLEERLGYTFQDKQLLEAALDWEKGSRYHYPLDSKKLEHLGDRLIGLIVSEELTATLPNHAPIPNLASRLVSNAMLSKIAGSLGIAKYILREKGNNPRKTFLADAFEAITYAVYLDSGRSMEIARSFVRKHVILKTGFAMSAAKAPHSGRLTN